MQLDELLQSDVQEEPKQKSAGNAFTFPEFELPIDDHYTPELDADDVERRITDYYELQHIDTF